MVHAIIRVGLYLGFLLTVVLGILFLVFWKPFVDDLRDRKEGVLPKYNRLDTVVFHRLGSLAPPRSNSFVNYPELKAEGVIRLCAIGDSFTYGSETGDGQDYPALMQRMLNSSGVDNVEVINFGNPWHGFHQNYLMWDLVARDYGCDKILLGPASFQPDRDTTFNHTNRRAPYYFHSRFVLEGEGVSLIDVTGVGDAQRFDGYWSFFPRLDYLRYDRNSPPLIQALIPKNRRIENPLYYYKGSIQNEAYRTYSILLHSLAEEGKQIFLMHLNPDILEIAAELRHDTLVTLTAFHEKRFPFWAPKSHYSATGNDLVAQKFLMAIFPEHRSELVLLKTYPYDDTIPADYEKRVSLFEYERIQVAIGNSSLGRFVAASPLPHKRGLGDEQSLHGSDVRSLLAVVEPGRPLTDSCFLPLRTDLYDGEDVVLVMHTGERQRFPLGRVQLMKPQLNFGFVLTDALQCENQEKLIIAQRDDTAKKDAIPRGGRATLMVGENTVAEGSIGSWNDGLLPISGDLLRLRSGENQYLDLNRIGGQGTFDLVLQHEGASQRFPIARWERKAIPRTEFVLNSATR